MENSDDPWDFDYEAGEWGDPLMLGYLPDEVFELEEIEELINADDHEDERDRVEVGEVEPEQFLFNFDLNGQNEGEVPNFHPVPREPGEEHMFSPEREDEEEIFDALIEAGAEEMLPDEQEEIIDSDDEEENEAVPEIPRADRDTRGL